MHIRSTLEDLEAALRQDQDTLSAVVRGHHVVDTALEELLHVALPHADQIELRRVSFLLKADFAIALGAVPLGSRVLFEQLNNVRNKFAHNPNYVLTAKELVAAKAALTSAFPGFPGHDRMRTANDLRAVLYWLTIGAWVVVDKARETVERQRAESVVLNERIVSFLASVTERERSAEEVAAYEQRVQKVIQSLRSTKSRKPSK